MRHYASTVAHADYGGIEVGAGLGVGVGQGVGEVATFRGSISFANLLCFGLKQKLFSVFDCHSMERMCYDEGYDPAYGQRYVKI
jgi:hypothetical protein